MYNNAGGHVGSTNYLVRPALNEWHNYAFTYNGSTRKIYLDGILDRQSLITTNVFDPNAFNITAAGEKMKGKMDDLRVYSRALSDSEIKAIYEATR
jgi:hypothetical protein